MGVLESRALFTKLSVDIKVIMSNQVPRIESLPIFLSLPQPLDTLQFNQAMRNRYRLRQRDPHLYDHLIPLLSDWASRPSENLLLAQPKADPKSARFFATDVVEAVRGTGIPILFALPARSVSGSKTTFVDVLRSLTLQALKMEHDSPASSFDQPISSREVENARDEGEWISLLNRAMADLERVFMVIDMDIIKDDVRLPQQKAIGIIEKLLELCGSTTKVKVILTARRFEQPGRGGRNAGSDEEDDDYDRKRRNQPARSYCFTDKKQRGPPRSPRYTKIGQKSPSYKPKQMAMTLRPAFASPRARATNRTISRKETVDSESE